MGLNKATTTTTADRRLISCQENADLTMPMVILRCGMWHHAAETLPDDDLFPSLSRSELMKHLDISISVNFHTMLIIGPVLEPEWSNDALFQNGNPVSAL